MDAAETMHSTLTLVIPAYNEAEALQHVLRELVEACEQNNWRIVVVDDGSTDDTWKVLAPFAESSFVRLVRHKVNRGYGGALKSGIRHVDTEWLITLDADGQHRVADIAAMQETLRRTDADMVVGSRGKRGGWSLYRRTGRWVIRALTRVLLPHHIEDINSGMKLCHTRWAKRYMAVLPDGMAFSDTFLLIFLHQRHRVVEHPIQVEARRWGRSTIGLHSALETVMQILHIVVLFHPMRLFLPLSLLAGGLGLLWGLPFLLAGLGLSTGAMLGIVTGMILFMLGLLAEQLSHLRKQSLLTTEAEADDDPPAAP